MSEPDKQISYLATALKAPRVREAAIRLAHQARDSGWTHEDYLIAVLDREVAARNASGAQLRIRAAGFPVTTSPHSPPGTTSLRLATSSCSDHPAPAKPT
jgi:hypothetical protein